MQRRTYTRPLPQPLVLGKTPPQRLFGPSAASNTIRISAPLPSRVIRGLVQHESCDGCCVTQLSGLTFFFL
jgi:hypothetical protein